MSDRLTDEQLVELVQVKSPADLTEAEVEQLRARVRESAALRETLIDHLHMESYLHAALGEYRVSIDELAQRVDETKRNRQRRSGLYGAGLGLIAILALVGGAIWVRSWDDARNREGIDVADNEQPNGGLGESGKPDDPNVDLGAAIDPSEREVDVEPPVEPWAVVVEAEDYVHSNLETDTKAYGRDIGVLVDGREEERFVEFTVNPPRAGLHQLELRYASDERRPLRLLVNGELVREDAAAADTGDWGPAGQRAFVQARVRLPADRCVIRLEGATFPHLDKLAVVLVEDGDGPVVGETDELPTLALRSAEAVEPGVVVGADGPWAPWLSVETVPANFEEVCFNATYPYALDGLSEDVLRKWLEKPRQGNFKIEHRRHWDVDTARFEGTARLVPEWPADAALRLALFDFDQFEFRFWDGDEGVVLRVDTQRRPGVWAAYRARRRDGRVDRDNLVLLTTDSGRHQRAHWGTFEIRWQNGSLVMTRGDLRLLTVPLDDPPSEVEWDGKVTVRGIAFYRSSPVPESAPAPQRIVQHVARPAELEWGRREQAEDGEFRLQAFDRAEPATWTVEAAENATLTGHADGLVTLEAKETRQPVEVAAPIACDGLSEFVVRIRDADPATGFFLGDESGRPIERLVFLADRKLNTTGFRLQSDDSHRHEVYSDTYHQPWLAAGNEQWFRVVPGAGVVKVFASGDGIHWGMVDQIGRSQPDDRIGSVGLFCFPRDEPRSIGLELVDVRELTALAELADAELEGRVPFDDLLAAPSSFETWYRAVLESRPEEVPFAKWRMACGIATLRQQPPVGLAQRLLEAIRESTIDGMAPADETLAVLEAVATLTDLRPGDRGAHWARELESWGRRLFEHREEDPLGTAMSAVVSLPLWTDADLRPALDMPALARDVVVRSAFEDRWEDVAAITNQRRFLRMAAHPDRIREMQERERRTVFEWAAVVAHRRLKRNQDPWLATFDRDWRHPLISQSTKEAYNVMAEFESALAAGAFEDACRIVASTDEQGIVGMLPDPTDRTLLVSLPRAVRSAMEDHPELQRTMREKFGAVAEIRVRRAIASGDVDGVTSATVRYLGTSAAATAHLWLGDRDISAGRVPQALAHYEAAAEVAPAESRAEVEARRELARAMLGQPVTTIDRPRIPIGEVALSSDEFAGLAERLRSRRAGDDARLVGATPPSRSPFAPGRVEATPRGRFDGDGGQGVDRRAPVGVDWISRQTAAVVVENDLLVNNRFQFTCFDATNGNRRWAVGLGGEQGYAHEWSLVPFQPLVVGPHLYVRRLTKEGAEIACLQRSDGKVVWRTDSSLEFASDPIVASGRIVAMAVEAPDDERLRADLVTLNPATGEVLARVAVLTERDAWNGMPPCGLVEAPGGVLGGVGASLFLAEPLGDVHWIRRLPWMPINVDERWFRWQVAPPVVRGNRFYVAWPHSHEIACHDVASGRTVWKHAVPRLRGLVGIVPGDKEVLVARTDQGFEGRSLGEGSIVWSQSDPEAYDDAILSDGRIVFVGGEPDDRPRGRMTKTSVIWIDGSTGDRVEQSPLSSFDHRIPEYGPLVVGPSGLWTFVGGNRRETARDLVLVRSDGRTAVDLAGHGGPRDREHAWQPGYKSIFDHFVQRVAPGWSLISEPTFAAGASSRREEMEGESDVLVTRAEPNHVTLFHREIDVPVEGECVLQLRVRNAGGTGWRLGVRSASRLLHARAVPNAWETLRVDLSEFAGRRIPVTISHEAGEDGSGVLAYWKAIAVVSEGTPNP